MMIDYGWNQTRIAKFLGVSPQAINKRFKKYRKDGLIRPSKVATKDARHLRLTNEIIFVLTPKGRKKLQSEGIRKLDDLSFLKEILKIAERLKEITEFWLWWKLKMEVDESLK